MVILGTEVEHSHSTAIKTWTLRMKILHTCCKLWDDTYSVAWSECIGNSEVEVDEETKVWEAE